MTEHLTAPATLQTCTYCDKTFHSYCKANIHNTKKYVGSDQEQQNMACTNKVGVTGTNTPNANYLEFVTISL